MKKMKELDKLNVGRVIYHVSLKEYTTYRVGGIANALVIVDDKESLKKLICYLEEHQIKWKIIGNGSNLIFKDGVYDGVLIHLANLNDMKIEDTHLCDFEILSSKLRYKDVLEIAKLRPLWGGDIKEPQFVLPNVTVKAEQITRHSNNKWNIIELPIANSEKIKVYQTQNAGEEGYNKLLMREGNGFNNPPKMLKMDLVVKMKMWEIEGQQYPYLQLVDYNVEKGRKARW